MTTTSDIVASIDTHIRACQEQITALEAARAALGRADTRSGATVPAAKAQRTTTRKPATRRRRSTTSARAEVVPAGKLETLLTASEGLTTAALAQQAGGDRNQVLALLRELESAGRVRRSGERRATKWHAVTDEDRIRERAEELEALRRKAA